MSSEFVCRFCQAELPAYVANDTCPECGCSIDLIDNNQSVESDESGNTEDSTKAKSNSFQLEGSVDNLSGQDLGDFRLLKPIARRGLGVVYRAQEKSRDRFVALMVIDSKVVSGEAGIDRMEIEARSVIELDHPNIVPVYDVGQVDGRHFVSMGLVEGQSLADKVADRAVSPNMAAELLLSVCEAVEFAHQRGILHRDLNLHNVLQDTAGVLRVADFGMARQPAWSGKDDETDVEEVEPLAGPSWGCMSPEQARIQSGDSSEAQDSWNDVTEAADVYGVGAILYSLVSGSPPLDGDTASQTLNKVIEQEPLRLSRIATASSLSKDLETICMKCLDKDPAERYPSVSAVKAELNRFIAGDPIDAKPQGVWGTIQRWRRMIAGNRDLRLRSAKSIAGFPLVSIAFGQNRSGSEEFGHAKGVIALGDRATGVIAYGSFARGAIAIGRIAVGLVSSGLLSGGVLSIGLGALGYWSLGAVAIGVSAFGLVAIGYKCLGLISLGYKAIGAVSKSFINLIGIWL